MNISRSVSITCVVIAALSGTYFLTKTGIPTAEAVLWASVYCVGAYAGGKALGIYLIELGLAVHLSVRTVAHIREDNPDFHLSLMGVLNLAARCLVFPFWWGALGVSKMEEPRDP